MFRDNALAALIREALEGNRDLGTSTPKTIDSGAEEQIHERCKHPFRSFQNDSAQGKDSSGAAAYRFSTGNPSARLKGRSKRLASGLLAPGSANSSAGNRNLLKGR